MSVQHLKPGDLFVTNDNRFGVPFKIMWRINEYGIPQIISREEDPDGVSQ